MRRLAAWLLVLAIAPWLMAEDHTFASPIPGVSVRVELPLGMPVNRGFQPLKVKVTNPTDLSLSWSLIGTQAGFKDQHVLLNETLEAEPRATKEYVFLMPVGLSRSDSHYGINLQLRGGGMTVQERNFSRYGESSELGFSVALAGENLSRFTALVSTPGAVSGRMRHDTPRTIQFGDLPADWRTYSGLDLLAIGRDEWEALGFEKRRSLREWVALGGVLMLVHEPGETPAFADLPRLDLGGRRAHGLGYLLARAAEENSGGVRLSDAVLEEIAKQEVPKFEIHNRNQNNSGLPYALRSPAALPIDSGDGWLVICLGVGVAVLMGPVNFFLLAPARRRQRIFYTLPMSALAATGVVIAAVYLADGSGGIGSRSVILAQVPGLPVAALWQRQDSRTGLMLGSDFPLADDVGMSDFGSLPSSSRDMRARGLSREGGRLQGDWFRNRGEQLQLLHAVVPLRSTLLFELDAAGRPTVRSSFPVEVRDVLVRLDDQTLWKADRLAPGESVNLVRAEEAVPEFFPDRSLQPMEFLATASGYEGIPIATDTRIKWLDDQVQVLGVIRAGGEVRP